MKKKISILLALAIALNPIIAKAADISDNNESQSKNSISNEIIYDVAKPYKTVVKESTEENFLISFAKLNNISYDEAKKINDQQNIIQPRITQYTTHYSTVSQYFKVNSDITLVMATEIKYIHDNYNGGNQISSVGSPYMGISALYGASLSSWSGGGFNIEQSISKARISTTGQAYIEISSSVSTGIDVAGLSFSTSTDYGTIYSTGVKTYAMTIYASNL